MNRIVVALVVLAFVNAPASAQVTSNVLLRVVQIKSTRGTCSAFTIEVADKQYLVTARHCLKGDKDASGLQIRQGSSWAQLTGPAYFPSNDEVDIAAIGLASRLTVDYKLEPASDKMIVGQQVYFLGFPSGLSTRWTAADKSEGEIAFVKAGILSAMDTRKKDAVIYYFDGHNNSGFSGGPIVFRPAPNEPLRVAAVVRGFKPEGAPVVKQADLGNLTAPAYQDLYTRTNAGIVIAYSIDHIVTAIREAEKPK